MMQYVAIPPTPTNFAFTSPLRCVECVDVLHCVAVCGSVLQYIAVRYNPNYPHELRLHFTSQVCCSVLQYVELCCSVL